MDTLIRIYVLATVLFMIAACAAPEYWNRLKDQRKLRPFIVQCSDSKYYTYINYERMDRDFICSTLGIEDTYEYIED